MSHPIITGKIDKSKVASEHLYTNPKSGKVSLDITLIPTPNSKYGEEYMIVQSVSREKRLKGIKGPILGNAKILSGVEHHAPSKAANEPADEDVAF